VEERRHGRWHGACSGPGRWQRIQRDLGVDGNGSVDALSDGVLILRYMLDPQGVWSTDDAVSVGATRTSCAAIQAFLDPYNPAQAASAALSGPIANWPADAAFDELWELSNRAGEEGELAIVDYLMRQLD
jgi:hypothetical protein